MAKYSKELTEEICKWLRAGNTQKDSAKLAGISEETYYTWQKEHPEFSESIEKAETECKARNIAIIQKAGEKQWQASAWYLERRHNKDFAIKQIQELQGQDGGPIKINIISDYISAPGIDATPVRDTQGQDPLQGSDMAQTSKENIDSTGKDSSRGT
jgi:DNA-binding XRE family transcriptional regulator